MGLLGRIASLGASRSGRFAVHFAGLGLALVLVFLPAWTLAGERNIDESLLPQLKAAIVLKITSFTSWPDSTPPDVEEKICLGIFCATECATAFHALTGNLVNGLPVQTRSLDTLAEGDSCRIIFFCGESDRFDEEELQAFLKTSPEILTVGDGESFNRLGGMVQLRLEGGRMSFQVNRTAGDRAGLRFSSHLLKVADLYEGDSR
jgi:hypothetical protein